jgi:hypothetical protein
VCVDPCLGVRVEFIFLCGICYRWCDLSVFNVIGYYQYWGLEMEEVIILGYPFALGECI